MARWIQELGTYEFKVIHRPGKRHGNADGLSRGPCKQCGRMDQEELPEQRSVIAAVAWGREGWEDIIRHQMGDRHVGTCLEVWKEAEIFPSIPPPEALRGSDEGRQVRTYWDRLEVRQGAVEWAWVEPDGQPRWLCYPVEEDRPHLVRECHEGCLGGHLGVDRMVSRIQRTWHWPGITAQVRSWVASCEGCQRRKPVHFHRRSLLQVLVPEGPWNRVAMDMMGPLPVTAQGNKLVLVVADAFTKWVEAFPVPNMEAKTVAGVVACEIICRFGTP